MSTTTDETTAAEALQKIADVGTAVQTLKATLAELRQQRKALADQAAEIRRRPLARADVKAFALAWIDECAQEYRQRAPMATMIERFMNPQPDNSHSSRSPMTMEKLDRLIGQGSSALGAISSPGGDFLSPPHSTFGPNSFARMYFFFGDAIKAKVSEAFDEYFANLPEERQDHAEPLAARRAALALLIEQDDALRFEHDDIASRLRAMGFAMTESAGDSLRLDHVLLPSLRAA